MCSARSWRRCAPELGNQRRHTRGVFLPGGAEPRGEDRVLAARLPGEAYGEPEQEADRGCRTADQEGAEGDEQYRRIHRMANDRVGAVRCEATAGRNDGLGGEGRPEGPARAPVEDHTAAADEETDSLEHRVVRRAATAEDGQQPDTESEAKEQDETERPASGRRQPQAGHHDGRPGGGEQDVCGRIHAPSFDTVSPGVNRPRRGRVVLAPALRPWETRRMAVLKVVRLGHPVLRHVAAPVGKEALRAADTQRLIDDLIETMDEYDGAGLAAPQVAVSKRIVVYGVDANPRYPDAEHVPLTVLVDPIVTPLTEEEDEDWEGCLSVPELRGMVPRRTRVRVDALGRDGRRLRFEASGFHARVVQHECDHLEGVVYLQRMRSLHTLSYARELARYGRPER